MTFADVLSLSLSHSVSIREIRGHIRQFATAKNFPHDILISEITSRNRLFLFVSATSTWGQAPPTLGTGPASTRGQAPHPRGDRPRAPTTRTPPMKLGRACRRGRECSGCAGRRSGLRCGGRTEAILCTADLVETQEWLTRAKRLPPAPRPAPSGCARAPVSRKSQGG